MALSLSGVPIDKRQAKRAFGASGNWCGASHADITRAIRLAGGSTPGRWRIRRSATIRAHSWLMRQCQTAAGDPVIATAYCRHRYFGITCGHAFVLVGCLEDSLLILDPLGRKPKGAAIHNAVVLPSQLDDALIQTLGSSWDICSDKEIATLRLSVRGQRSDTENLPAHER